MQYQRQNIELSIKGPIEAKKRTLRAKNGTALKMPNQNNKV